MGIKAEPEVTLPRLQLAIGWLPPFGRRERRPRGETALKIEDIVHGGIDAEEGLRGSSRFDALHRALSSSHDLMRVLGANAPPKPPSRWLVSREHRNDEA